jgi:hypothetical protein
MFRSVRNCQRNSGDPQLKKELSLLLIYWISLLAVSVSGGIDPHNLGLVALVPAVMSALIIKQKRKSFG